MVTRTSQEVQLNTGPTQQQYVQPTGGYVRPNAAAEYTKEVDSGRDRILAGILGEAERTARQGAQRSLEDAYLQGVAKVGQIESEAELEGDMFTKDWAVAGYRDTMGKFAMADAEAQLALDMKWLRQEQPEKMQQYLNEQRTKLLPTLEGMSREQRNGAFASIALNTRSAIKTHTTEHQKFIVETEQRAVGSLMSAAMTTLTDTLASGSTESYRGKVDSAYSTIYGSVWQNPKFDASMKQKLTVQAMEYALSTNNLALYDKMQRTSVDDKLGSMFAQLPIGEQEKLAEKYRIASERTAGQRNTLWLDMNSQLEVQLERGETAMNFEQMVQHLDQGMSLGVVNQAKRDSIMQKWSASTYKQGTNTALANAYASGDVATIQRFGDNSKAKDAANEAYRKAGLTPVQMVAKHLQAGENGMVAGYKAAGEIANTSISQMARPDGTVDPQHAGMLASLNAELDRLEKNPNNIGKTEVLAGLSEPNRMRVQRMRAYEREGVTGDAAVARLLDEEKNDRTSTPQVKAAISQQNAAEDAKFLLNIESAGPASRLFTSVKSLWSEEAALLNAARPQARLFNAPPAKVAGEWSRLARGAVAEEFQRIDLAHSNLSRDDRYELALSNVSSRTVKTNVAGPVVLPQGQDAAAYFGVKASNETIGKAVDTLLKPRDKDSFFTVQAESGRLVVQEYDKNGTPLTTSANFISPQEVAKEVQRGIDKQTKTTDTLMGSGKQTTRDGVTVKYNGANSAAVAPDLMLKFRDNLVQNEGVRDKVYADTKGNKTGGVGVAGDYFKQHFGDLPLNAKLPQQAIDESFRVASSEAAQTGATLQKALGLNEQGFLLTSELAYHSGRNFANKIPAYKPLMVALMVKDGKAAAEAFKDTPAYKVSAPSRRAHYMKLIEETTKG